MGAFERLFQHVVVFSDEVFVVSRDLHSREEAADLIQREARDYHDDPNLVVRPEDLEPDYVRFCIQYDPEISDNRLGWWLGVHGRGSKPVWVWY